jgi:hypothetical protein
MMRTGLTSEFYTTGHSYAASHFAEKLDPRTSAAKGVTDSVAVMASLKRCPDTNQRLSANYSGVAQRRTRVPDFSAPYVVSAFFV